MTGEGPGASDEWRTSDAPQSDAAAPPPGPAPSRRAVDLVAAYGVAQWNVVQARVLNVSAEQFREAKDRQVAAYRALMAYIAALERPTESGRG